MNSLRSSDAFSNIPTTQSSDARNSQELPGALSEDVEHAPSAVSTTVPSETGAVSSQITALLSQLGPRPPRPKPPEELPLSEPLEDPIIFEPPPSEPSVPQRAPVDLKSMGYAESLSRIEPLLSNPVASSILRKVCFCLSGVLDVSELHHMIASG